MLIYLFSILINSDLEEVWHTRSQRSFFMLTFTLQFSTDEDHSMVKTSSNFHDKSESKTTIFV